MLLHDLRFLQWSSHCHSRLVTMQDIMSASISAKSEQWRHIFIPAGKLTRRWCKFQIARNCTTQLPFFLAYIIVDCLLTESLPEETSRSSNFTATLWHLTDKNIAGIVRCLRLEMQMRGNWLDALLRFNKVWTVTQIAQIPSRPLTSFA